MPHPGAWGNFRMLPPFLWLLETRTRHILHNGCAHSVRCIKDVDLSSSSYLKTLSSDVLEFLSIASSQLETVNSEGKIGLSRGKAVATSFWVSHNQAQPLLSSRNEKFLLLLNYLKIYHLLSRLQLLTLSKIKQQ